MMWANYPQNLTRFTAQTRLLRGGGQKSLVVAYLLLLFGGIFGLHHFYLGNFGYSSTHFNLCTMHYDHATAHPLT